MHGEPPPGFCPGTLIATPEGARPIEAFVPGDTVSLADGGTAMVWWIGRRDFVPAELPAAARAGLAPVRLPGDSWGAGQPARELLVSPTSLLHRDGAAIAAGGLLPTTEPTGPFAYLHLELNAPGLLLAEGVAAESFRARGDRNLFGNVASYRGPPRHLSEHDADLHLLADGARLDPVVTAKGEASFEVPAGIAALVIASRWFVPALADPALADRRHLGVCLLRLRLEAPGFERTIPAEDAALEAGFFPAEDGRRWTDGAGVVPSHLFAAAPSGFRLTLGLAGVALPYGRGRPVPRPPIERPMPGAPRMLSSAARVLVIDASVPTPDRDAGSNVILWHMRLLGRLGLAATFLPVNLTAFPGYTEALRREGIETVQTPAYGSVDAFLRDQGAGFDLIYLHRFTVAEACLPGLRRWAPQAPILFNPADLHHLRLRREARLRATGPAEANHVRARELAVIAAADVTLVCNTVERGLIRDALPDAETLMLPWVIETPAGTPPPFEARAGLMFLGGFGHRPNLDAARWMVAEVFPILRGMRPEAELTIYGADVPPEIAALAGEGVRVAGHVSELGPVLDAHRIMVAPLRYGAGFKGKIAEALAAGLPIVATSAAAEGSGLVAGEHFVLADTAFAMAASLARLERDAFEWARLSGAGRDFAREHLSPERGLDTLRSALLRSGLRVREAT